jgi:hypothetical protein
MAIGIIGIQQEQLMPVMVQLINQKACTRHGLPTKRAVDWRDSARFTRIFLASGFFCSQTFSQPARQPLTQTVGRWHPENRILKRRKQTWLQI